MFSSLKSYFVGVYSELKKTSWPDRSTLINYTIIVVVSSVAAIALLTIIDLGLSNGIQFIVNHAR